jgi:glutaminyl-peptide cyclotransferase
MWNKLILLLLFITPTLPFTPLKEDYEPIFSGESAYTYLTEQCDFGPRPPGSQNLDLCRQYIAEKLESEGWDTHFQNFTYLDVECSNIIATWSSKSNETIILGAHYDTRPHADHDPDSANRTKPILGANDGASGVALLLELAKILPENVRPTVEIVFFDAEDSGGINGWDWIQGSNYYVSQLTDEMKENITAMVLLDMIGDRELRLLRESSSTDSLQDLVWSIAEELNYNDTFLDSPGGSILDDHRPFLNAGIPSLDIIQHAPFPWYWHTLEDTPDKCSAESLEIVGRVIEVFLVNYFSEGISLTRDPLMLEAIIPLLVLPVVVIIVYLWYRQRKR